MAETLNSKLELKPMRILRRPQSEHRSQVCEEQLPVLALLDCGNHQLVHHLLVSLALIADLIRLLFRGEDVAFLFLSALLTLPPEVRVIQLPGQFDIADVQLGVSSNDVTRVDSTQRTGIYEERASYQEKAGFELLEQNHTFAFVCSG